MTGGGLSDELLQATFGVGLKGVSTENCEKVEQLVLSTLSDLAKSGCGLFSFFFPVFFLFLLFFVPHVHFTRKQIQV